MNISRKKRFGNMAEFNKRFISVDSTLEARAILSQMRQPKRHKYRAIPTTVDGIRFDSKREAERYRELELLRRVGQIWGLTLQPRFPLHAVNLTTGEITQVGTYVADFSYYMGSVIKPESITEDSKGFRTPTYRLKKKMVEAEYGITIREV